MKNRPNIIAPKWAMGWRGHQRPDLPVQMIIRFYKEQFLKMVRVSFPNLKLSTQSISLRLPLSLLEAIRIEANKRDVPYQSLIKVWLAERLRQC